MSTVENRTNLLPLVNLVAKASVEGPDALTVEELTRLSDAGEDLHQLLYQMYFSGVRWCKDELSFRQRREELEALPTDELEAMYRRVRAVHMQAMADDVDDEADDSLYAPPPIDSDEHVLYVILEERRAKEAS